MRGIKKSPYCSGYSREGGPLGYLLASATPPETPPETPEESPSTEESPPPTTPEEPVTTGPCSLSFCLTEEQVGCWEECASESQCPTELTCQDVDGTNRCVNVDCPAETNCTYTKAPHARVHR